MISPARIFAVEAERTHAPARPYGRRGFRVADLTAAQESGCGICQRTESVQTVRVQRAEEVIAKAVEQRVIRVVKWRALSPTKEQQVHRPAAVILAYRPSHEPAVYPPTQCAVGEFPV